MRRLTPKLLVGAVAGLGAVAAIGIAAAGWALTRPATARLGDPPPDLSARRVAIAPGARDTIHGWFAPGSPGGGAVLLLHPVRTNRAAMLGRARFLHRAGYAVLLIDMQAHGETRGARITFGARESLDAAAALGYLRAAAPGERIGAIGVSLGGAASLLGDGPLAVDALVLEAVYPTIEDAVTDRLRNRFGPFGPPAVPLLTSQLRRWTGVGTDELRPIDAMPRLKAPLLLIAGAEDPLTTLPESQRLFQAAPEPRQLWIVPGAGHVDYHALRRDEYESRVAAFFERYLRAAR